MNCDRCYRPNATYDGPNGAVWCLSCFSGWQDWLCEMNREGTLEARDDFRKDEELTKLAPDTAK